MLLPWTFGGFGKQITNKHTHKIHAKYTSRLDSLQRVLSILFPIVCMLESAYFTSERSTFEHTVVK